MIVSRKFSHVSKASPKYEFLIRITHPESGLVVGYYMTKFAFNGADGNHQRQRAWNFVQTGLNEKTISSGFNHEVVCWGREGHAAGYIKEHGIALDQL